MTRVRQLLTNGGLNELYQDLARQSSRRGAWGVIADHLMRTAAVRVSALERRLDGAVWWSRDSHSLPVPDEIDRIARWCLDTGTQRIVPHASMDGSQAVTALLPLRERGDITCVLKVTLDGEITGSAIEDLGAVVVMVDSWLSNRSWSREACLSATLASRLSAATGITSGAESALATVALAVDAAAGALFEVAGQALVAIATTGELNEEQAEGLTPGSAVPSEAISDVVDGRQVRFIGRGSRGTPRLLTVDRDALLLPLEGCGPVKSVLCLWFETESVPADADLSVLLGASDVFSAHLRRLRSVEATNRFDEVSMWGLSSPRREVVTRLLEVALEVVPGAEHGVVLRRENDETFTTDEDAGSDLVGKLTEEDLMGMYRGSQERWRQGIPSSFSAGDDAAGLIPARWTGSGAEGEEPRCLADGLCVPLSAHGVVVAVLLLVGGRRDALFDDESLDAAWRLSMTASMMLNRAPNDETILPIPGSHMGFSNS